MTVRFLDSNTYSARVINEVIRLNQSSTRARASAVFEEGGFPTSEFTNIYGLMTAHGIPKPGWRGFQLLNEAGDTRVPVSVTAHDSKLETPPTKDEVQRPDTHEGASSGASCLQGAWAVAMYTTRT